MPELSRGPEKLSNTTELPVVVGAFTVRVNVEILVIDPAVAVTVTVEFPVGVDERVLIVRVEEQVGEQAVGENDAVAPVGSPEIVKLVD